MASLYLIGTTDTTASVGISGMAGGHAGTRYFRWYLNGSHVDTTTSPPLVTGTSYDYEGLTASTTYSLSVEIYNYNNTILYATLEPIDDATTAASGGSGGTVSIVDGGVWKAATVYIVDGGVWKAATLSIVDGGVWKAVT